MKADKPTSGHRESLKFLRALYEDVESLEKRVKKLSESTPHRLLVIYDGEPAFLWVDAKRDAIGNFIL